LRDDESRHTLTPIHTAFTCAAVNRRSKPSFFAIVLCVLALFVVQAFGGKAAYYCLCGGKPVQTVASHCHGLHSESCVAAETQETPSDCETEGGSRRDHLVIDQQVQLRPVEAAQQTIAPPAVAAILPIFEVLAASQNAELPAVYCVDFGESPPFGVTVARTIVLLI